MTTIEHDLVAGDPHTTRMGRDGAFCNCFGPCCFDSNDCRCLCQDCDCHDTTARRSVAVRIAPPPEHVCQDCGTEVFRNGTRGRFPSRCPECKGKQ